MDWNGLQYFLVVARTGSQAGAARVLEVEHTTVGRRLTALEEALGVRLFDRTRDGLTLTAAGRQILPLIESAERAISEAQRTVLAQDRRIEGTVRLTTSEAFSRFLIPYLAELRGRHPGLTVEIVTGNTVLDLTRREADLAVRFAATLQSELRVRRIGDVGWSLYASVAYLERAGAPGPDGELRGHDVIGFDGGLARLEAAVWLAAHSEGTREILRGNSIMSVLSATAGGLGVAVLPCCIAEREAGLRRVGPVVATVPLWLVVHPDVARVARVRAVMDFITEVMAREEAFLRGQ